MTAVAYGQFGSGPAQPPSETPNFGGFDYLGVSATDLVIEGRPGPPRRGATSRRRTGWLTDPRSHRYVVIRRLENSQFAGF